MYKTASKQVRSLIDRRRRQLHVHSVIYYHLGTSIVSDAVFDRWSTELVDLQREYPGVGTYRTDLFVDWSGDTGMHLHVDDRTASLAKWLIKRSEHEIIC